MNNLHRQFQHHLCRGSEWNNNNSLLIMIDSQQQQQQKLKPFTSQQQQQATATIISSSSLVNHFFTSSSTANTTNLYYSILDSCSDDLSTSGGSSTASSGYGRSASTASNCSATGGGSSLLGTTSTLGLGYTQILDNDNPSPTPLFRDILLSRPTSSTQMNQSMNRCNSMSPSSNVIDRPSSVSNHSTTTCLTSTDSSFNTCNFFNTPQFHDLPKLISPSNSSSIFSQHRQHHTSGPAHLYGDDSSNTNDLFGNLKSSIISHPQQNDLLLSTHHHKPVGSTNASSLFSDFTTSELMFGSDSDLSTTVNELPRIISNNKFMDSSITPSMNDHNIANQCFSVDNNNHNIHHHSVNKHESLDKQSDSLLDKRTAVAVAAACLNESVQTTFAPPPNHNNSSVNNHDSGSVHLCERDLLYRLIIRFVIVVV